MGKEFIFKMSNQVIEYSSRPLRSREEAVLLLLHTIRMFDISEWLNADRKEEVIISIDKMNRIFYILEGKIFSMQFPFYIEKSSEAGDIRIYHGETGIEINAVVLSSLIAVFEKMSCIEVDFDVFFEIFMESESNNESITTNSMWILFSHLLKYDLGYLRYDNDIKNENGSLHPLYHLDICLESSVTFKLGLNKRISFDEFKDILDNTTECSYIV